MVRVAPIQTGFNSGEFSPLLDGLIGLEQRATAFSYSKNLLVLKQGPITRRGGTRYAKNVKNSANRTHLVPFRFNLEQNYQIEFGDQYFRFYASNAAITNAAQNITGITQASPAVVTYSGADTYANGDEVFISGVSGMTQVNGNYYKVANVNAGSNTFELTDLAGANVNSTGFSAYTSGGTVAEVLEVASPYTQANLFDANGIFQVQYAQSADVLYLVHEKYKPRALTRTSSTSWTVSALDFVDGPYLDENITATTLGLSGTSGSVTVTASSATGINGGSGFQTTDVGRLIRWYDGTNWTWLEITARASTTSVTATIRGANAAATTATTKWRLGAYSDTTGYPRAITFFQNRVCVGGGTDVPDFYAFTITGGFTPTSIDFRPSAPDGTVSDDDGITGVLTSGRVNAIQWMDSDTRGLVVGTAEQEWLIRASTQGEAITPSNVSQVPFSKTGSAYIQNVRADNANIFVQFARRKVFDIRYDFEQDSLRPQDQTLFAEHITRNGVVGMAYQQEPINTVWFVLGDGALMGMTYFPGQRVTAWHRHILGGYSDANKTSPAIVESVSVIPSADGTRDELWLIVRRHINGQTVRSVEYMTRYYENDIAKEDAFQVDMGLTYDGAPVSSVSGLAHLEGETVKVMVDGKSHPDLVVGSGAVTLANGVSGSVVHVGLGNSWAVETLRPEAGAQDGTAQGKTKRINAAKVRLLNTLGLKYGQRNGQIDEYDFNQGASYDEELALFSGDTEILAWPTGYEIDGKMYFEHDGVFPATILAVMPYMTTYDRG